MEKCVLDVRMLGQFSICMGEAFVNDQSDRSKKLWLLLAYLIVRRRPVAQEELLNLLWGNDAERSSGALKTTVHRLRALLDKLYPGAGHEIIAQDSGCYRWNERFEIHSDVDEFEALCAKVSSLQGSARADILEKAIELYCGPFLERLSSEAWVVPIAAHYHNLYIKAVSEALPLLKELGRSEKAIIMAEKAIEIEPYQEEFYRFLMQLLLETGQAKRAVALYEQLRRLMLSEFGVIPEEATRHLYYKAVRSINDHIIQVDFIRDQLRETDALPGCMVCDYDFFKVLYRAEARAIARSGNCVHISLVTLTGENGEDLPRRSLDKAMDNMEELIRSNLRKGDIISRCSISQFVMMLPQANYENSCMVSERLIRAFSRRYPHSPARLDYSVWALEPSE